MIASPAVSSLGLVAAFCGAVPSVIVRSRQTGGVDVHFDHGRPVEFLPDDLRSMTIMAARVRSARHYRPARLSGDERAELVAALTGLADKRAST